MISDFLACPRLIFDFAGPCGCIFACFNSPTSLSLATRLLSILRRSLLIPRREQQRLAFRDVFPDGVRAGDDDRHDHLVYGADNNLHSARGVQVRVYVGRAVCGLRPSIWSICGHEFGMRARGVYNVVDARTFGQRRYTNQYRTARLS